LLEVLFVVADDNCVIKFCKLLAMLVDGELSDVCVLLLPDDISLLCACNAVIRLVRNSPNAFAGSVVELVELADEESDVLLLLAELEVDALPNPICDKVSAIAPNNPPLPD